MKKSFFDTLREMIKSGVDIKSSVSRGNYIFKVLTAKNEVRFEHLFKLYFYPEANRFHGVWMRSVFASAFEVHMINHNKYPDRDLLFGVLWDKDKDDIEQSFDDRVFKVSRNIKQYYAPVRPISVQVQNNCIKYMESYHEWLSERLSKVGHIISADCYAKLRELLSQSTYQK